jgi:hypothetical protein
MPELLRAARRRKVSGQQLLRMLERRKDEG